MSSLGHRKLDEALGSLRESLSLARGGLGPGRSAGAGRAAILSEIDGRLERLANELELLVREHAGLADELLRAYEQLGIVFEVTRKLSTVSTEDQVVRLFIDSLRRTYHDNHVCSVRRGDGQSLDWGTEPSPAQNRCAVVVEESISGMRVVVRTLDGPAEGILEVLSAPVFAGAKFVCAIVVTHGTDARRFEASDMSLVEALALFCGDLIRNYDLAHELRGLSVDLVRALVRAIDQKDAYTSGHSNRVGRYARLLGAELGLDNDELQMLEWAALLHDVGKIGIRDDVLKKAGRLTAEEFEHIKEHPVRSDEVVRSVPKLRDALAGVRHHHERYDGSGYPDKLAGEDIPLQARIIQVADIFDALTTSRSYRGAFNWEKALGILRDEAGRVADPSLVELFERCIRRDAGKMGIGSSGPDGGWSPQGSGAGRDDERSEDSSK